MIQVNVHEAKTHLSRLLKQVAEGEEVVISNRGEPIARLVAYKQATVRKVGWGKELIGAMASDFDAPL
ncbi:MAG: type II toxin-antitoxin system Phd/YefM family antitoxin, partial [Candidatus Sericytochromatia bacterium]|nr:type II toxin-antitoxin system Phd/YefM family antitoxin [Candidatus Tanganyikabacteria bacterium]